MYIFDPADLVKFSVEHNKFIKEPNFMNVICYKKVYAPITITEKYVFK